MFKKMCFAMAFANFCLLIWNCNKDKATTEHRVICYYDQNITWNNYVRFLVQNSCAVSGCHVAGNIKGLGDYSTYAGLKAVVDDSTFEKTVLIDNLMPKGAKLNDSILVRLECWFQNGAPE